MWATWAIVPMVEVLGEFMRRRSFFGALFTAAAAPVVPNRVYSFLWDRPLVTISAEILDPDGTSITIDTIMEATNELRRNNAAPRDDGAYIIDIPPRLAQLMGERLLEQAFHEPLFPNMLNRDALEKT